MTAPTDIALAPLSALYGALTRVRLSLYRAGALPAHRIDAPVISVGNITTGGTGKTPLVASLAERLAEWGERVCILTRGYGRANPKEQVVVSDGECLLADARTGGDEPRLLAELLIGRASVVCNANRVEAARWALKNLGATVFILDDGFQHLALARDLNLLTIDATNPWGGGRLLPRGRLREPLEGIERADAIIITRANQAQDVAELRTEASHLSKGRPILLSLTRTTRVRPLGVTSGSVEEDAQNSFTQPVAAFCALGNPQAFFAQAEQAGCELAYTKSFPDHHLYSQHEIDAMVQEARSHGAVALLTTAKDAVKLGSLSFELPCRVLEIELGFDDEKLLLELLRTALAKGRGAT